MARGEPTGIFGDAALATDPAGDCDGAEAQWDLTPSVGATYTIRNVESELTLDVLAAGDLPGTAVILYEAFPLDHQRFFARLRSPEAYELSPRHAPDLCVEARSARAEIWTCDGEVAAQTFHFLQLSCP